MGGDLFFRPDSPYCVQVGADELEELKGGEQTESTNVPCWIAFQEGLRVSVGGDLFSQCASHSVRNFPHTPSAKWVVSHSQRKPVSTQVSESTNAAAGRAPCH